MQVKEVCLRTLEPITPSLPEGFPQQVWDSEANGAMEVCSPVLEVKYDEFLPDTIAQQLEIGKLRKTAFSKYYLGRLAVRGEFPIER